MKYHDEYLKLREKMWASFDQLVKTGAIYQQLLDVCYPHGINPKGLSIDTEGRSWFLAQELIANPDYKMHVGIDMIVGTGEVTFIDCEGIKHTLEPDILDLYWLSQALDGAN